MRFHSERGQKAEGVGGGDFEKLWFHSDSGQILKQKDRALEKLWVHSECDQI